MDITIIGSVKCMISGIRSLMIRYLMQYRNGPELERLKRKILDHLLELDILMSDIQSAIERGEE